MAPWSRAAWSDDTLDADAFSLIVIRSTMLGLADSSGDPLVLEHWGHADAGGDLTQDGTERLLAWMQMDLQAAGASGISSEDHVRHLPVQSSLLVTAQALERIGSLALAEVDAIVPLWFMADSLAQLATGRDWLGLGSSAAARETVLIEVESAYEVISRDQSRILECLRTLGGEVLGAVDASRAEVRRRSPHSERRQFLNRSFSSRSIEIECSTHRWSVDFAAWVIELVAYACHCAGVDHDVLIAVRRADL